MSFPVRSPIADEMTLVSEACDSGTLSTKVPGTTEIPMVITSIIGRIWYGSRWNRPDFLYTVPPGYRRSHSPITHNVKIRQRITLCLAGIFELKIRICGCSDLTLGVSSATDAEYNAEKWSRYVSGALPIVGCMPVTWYLKQKRWMRVRLQRWGLLP